MYTGLLAHRNDLFQLVVVGKRQGDGDLIHFVLRQDIFEIAYRAKDFDALIDSPDRNMVVKDPVAYIAPLGIGIESVDVRFRRPGITDQENMLKIVAFSAEVIEEPADKIPVRRRNDDIDRIENEDQRSRIIDVHLIGGTDHEQRNDDYGDTDRIGPDDLGHFCPYPFNTF